METKHMKNTAFAVMAVAVLLAASVGGAVFVDEESDESDAIAPLLLAAVVFASAAGGFALGWYVGSNDTSDTDVMPYLRLDDAKLVTSMTDTAAAFTANANTNYASIWGMTKEHWIRQAEIEVYSQWKEGGSYSSDAVLEGARIYENHSVMTANAVAQINAFFNTVSKHIEAYGSKDTYKGNMKAGLVFGNDNAFTSVGNWNADLISVPDTSVSNKVYIGYVKDENFTAAESISEAEAAGAYKPSYLYCFSDTAKITDGEHTYSLSKGKTYLSALENFEPGIYTVENGMIGGDSLAEVLGEAELKAGLAVECDGNLSYAYLDGSDVKYNSMTYKDVSFQVVPSKYEGGDAPAKTDLTRVLTAYQKLLDKMVWTAQSADSSASAVWKIYDSAQSKNASITTLMASNVYDTYVLSDGMNEAMTLSASKQLTDWYSSHNGDLSGLSISLYSSKMDAPFIRGSVTDSFGNTVYKDAVFTVFLQEDDATIKTGSDYTLTQNATLAVWTAWDDSWETLEDWKTKSDMKTSDCTFDTVGEGYVISVTEQATVDKEGLHQQDSIDYKVTKARYIAPEDITDPGHTEPKDSDTDWLKIVCIVGGAVLLLLGIVYRRADMIVIGGIVLVFGVVFADTVWDKIQSMKLF